MQPESTKNFSGAYRCCRWQPTDPREIAERQSSVFRAADSDRAEHHKAV